SDWSSDVCSSDLPTWCSPAATTCTRPSDTSIRTSTPSPAPATSRISRRRARASPILLAGALAGCGSAPQSWVVKVAGATVSADAKTTGSDKDATQDGYRVAWGDGSTGMYLVSTERSAAAALGKSQIYYHVAAEPLF